MAAAAYTLSFVALIPPRNRIWHMYHTNTSASVAVADFALTDIDKLQVGDYILATKVDDLTLVEGNTIAVSGSSLHVVNANTGTAVDVSNTLLATYTDAT